MSATTSGALKAKIESLGLGLMAYRDEAPAATPRPYVTISEEIISTPDPLEDGQSITEAEQVQVDLWQDWKNSLTGAVAENYALARALRQGLNGVRLGLIGTAITYVVVVIGSVRLLEPDENIVHHALTVEVHREF